MSLEKVVISFEGDTSALQPVVTKLKEMGTISDENAAKFKRASEDHKKGLKDSGDEVQRLENRFQSLSERIIAVFAIQRIKDFTVESVKAFAAAEEATKQLGFAVTKINGESGIAFKKLIDQSNTLADSLNQLYTPKQIQEAQKQLATFGLTSKQIEKLTPQIIDMAAATGKDLTEATEKSILAINGQTKGLRDVGISFKDTGDKTKNLSLLTNDLTKFQGAAAEQITTTAGALQEWGNIWDEIKEKIGGFLADTGNEFLNFWDILSGKITMNESLLNIAAKKNMEDATTYVQTFTDNLKGSVADQTTAINNQVAVFQKQIGFYQLAEDKAKSLGTAGDDYATAAKIKLDALGDKVKLLKDYLNDLVNPAKLKDDATGAGKTLTDLTDQIADANKKLLEDYYNAEKKSIDDVAAMQKTDAESQIKDKEALNVALLAIDEDATNKKLAIDKQLAEVEYDAQVTKINNMKATEVQKNELLLAVQKDYNQQLEILETQAAETNLAAEKKSQADILKIREDAAKEDIKIEENRDKEIYRHAEEVGDKILEMAKLEAEQKKADGVISEQEYNVEVDKLELARFQDMKKNLLAEDQLLIDDAQKKLDIAAQNHEDTRQLQIDLDAAKNKLDEDQLDAANKISEAQIKLQEDTADKVKDVWKTMFDVFTDIMTNVENAIQANIDAIDTQMTRQSQMIDYQKTLAERGLANDLAFEEKRADQLAEKKLKEQRKLERAKELETFLNSVAKFSEDNPNSAVAKALGVLAATKAAETLFAEEGGVVGSRLPSAYGRRHRSGKDRLVLAEDGEGILSKREMDLLGGEGGFMKIRNFIKDPLRERMIPSSSVAIMRNDNSELVKELNAIKKAVEQIPQMKIEWDGLDARIETKIQSGVTERMKVVTGKRRL